MNEFSLFVCLIRACLRRCKLSVPCAGGMHTNCLKIVLLFAAAFIWFAIGLEICFIPRYNNLPRGNTPTTITRPKILLLHEKT